MLHRLWGQDPTVRWFAECGSIGLAMVSFAFAYAEGYEPEWLVYSMLVGLVVLVADVIGAFLYHLAWDREFD